MHEGASCGNIVEEESILFQVEGWATEKILKLECVAKIDKDGKCG